MPNATATQVKKSNNPFDIFITGLRKGFNVAINNLADGFRFGLYP